MSDSVLPHRRQPTRLPRPWDSPGKNTGVGCHFLLQCMKVKSESEVTQSCLTLCDPTDHSLPGSSIHGIFQARVLEWGAIAFSKISFRMNCLDPLAVQGILKSHLQHHSSKASILWPSAFFIIQLSHLYVTRRQWQPTPVLLPGESHGWRSLVGCGPWGREESDTTERLHFHFSLSHIGEGNGNPLQCSSLKNPRDGGAWWAAVYGVAQSRTRLKRLSSSSSSFKFQSVLF